MSLKSMKEREPLITRVQSFPTHVWEKSGAVNSEGKEMYSSRPATAKDRHRRFHLFYKRRPSDLAISLMNKTEQAWIEGMFPSE